MDNKLLLIFILLFLSFLLLFYYLKLKTNIIMLLSIIIVLCINKLIVQKEYFNDNYDHIYNELIAWMNSSPDNESTPELFRFNGSESGLKTTAAQSENAESGWENILKSMKKLHDPLPTQHQSPFMFDRSIPNPSTHSLPTTIP